MLNDQPSKAKIITFFLGLFAVVVMFFIYLTTLNDADQASKSEQENAQPPAEESAVKEEKSDVKDTAAPAFDSKVLAASPKENWVTNGGDLSNQRFSTLDEIDTSNIKDLKGKWVTHLGSGKEFKYSGEATPVVYNGVMYVVTGAMKFPRWM